MPSSTEGQLIQGSPSSSKWSDGSDIDDGPAAPERDSLHHRDLDLESVDSPPPPTDSHRGGRARERDSSFHRGGWSSRPPRDICELLQDASFMEPEARRGLWRSPPPSHGPWPLRLLHGPPPHRRPRPSPPSSSSPAAAFRRRQVPFVAPHTTHPRPLAIPPGFPAALPPNAEALPPHPQQQQAADHRGQDRRFHFHPYQPSPFAPRDLRREWATGAAAMDRRASPSPSPPLPCSPENPPPSHGGDGRLQ